jgi:hypothetical protein
MQVFKAVGLLAYLVLQLVSQVFVPGQSGQVGHLPPPSQQAAFTTMPPPPVITFPSAPITLPPQWYGNQNSMSNIITAKPITISKSRIFVPNVGCLGENITVRESCAIKAPPFIAVSERRV